MVSALDTIGNTSLADPARQEFVHSSPVGVAGIDQDPDKMNMKSQKLRLIWSIAAAIALTACGGDSAQGTVTYYAGYLIDGFSSPAISVASGGVLPKKGEISEDSFAVVEFHQLSGNAGPILFCRRAGHLFFYDIAGAPSSGDINAWLTANRRSAITLDGDNEWIKAALHASGVSFTNSAKLAPLAEIVSSHLRPPAQQARALKSQIAGSKRINLAPVSGGNDNPAAAYLKACTA